MQEFHPSLSWASSQKNLDLKPTFSLNQILEEFARAWTNEAFLPKFLSFLQDATQRIIKGDSADSLLEEGSRHVKTNAMPYLQRFLQEVQPGLLKKSNNHGIDYFSLFTEQKNMTYHLQQQIQEVNKINSTRLQTQKVKMLRDRDKEIATLETEIRAKFAQDEQSSTNIFRKQIVKMKKEKLSTQKEISNLRGQKSRLLNICRSKNIQLRQLKDTLIAAEIPPVTDLHNQIQPEVPEDPLESDPVEELKTTTEILPQIPGEIERPVEDFSNNIEQADQQSVNMNQQFQNPENPSNVSPPRRSNNLGNQQDQQSALNDSTKQSGSENIPNPQPQKAEDEGDREHGDSQANPIVIPSSGLDSTCLNCRSCNDLLNDLTLGETFTDQLRDVGFLAQTTMVDFRDSAQKIPDNHITNLIKIHSQLSQLIDSPFFTLIARGRNLHKLSYKTSKELIGLLNVSGKYWMENSAQRSIRKSQITPTTIIIHSGTPSVKKEIW